MLDGRQNTQQDVEQVNKLQDTVFVFYKRRTVVK